MWISPRFLALCCLLCLPFASLHEVLVVQAEELHDGGRVLRPAGVVAHPAGLRQEVVRPRLALSHELSTHLDRKWQVRHPAAVQVSDLVAPQPKLYPAKPMWPRLDPRPPQNLTLYHLSQ